MKQLFKISIIGVVTLLGGLVGVSQALDLSFPNLTPSFIPGTFPVSFVGGGEFAGSLIITRTEILKTPATITFGGGTELRCKRKLHGYYYNAARGDTLLPLSRDEQLNGSGITINPVGDYGIFTACGSGNNLYDIVGTVSYMSAGTGVGSIVFGVVVDAATNSATTTYQPGAITWRQSNGINGSFFDTMYGVGLANSAGSNTLIGSVSDLLGQFSPIYIQGKVGIGQSVDSEERGILSINLAGTKTILKASDDANFSSIINTVNKNASILCRNKTIIENINDLVVGGDAACVNALANPIRITLANLDTFTNKDVVVLRGDVVLDKNIFNRLTMNNYLSLYIAQGNLIIDQNTTPGVQRRVDSNDQLASGVGTTRGVYLVGNFFINGLLLGADISPSIPSVSGIPYKTYIMGKLASLNTLSTVSEKRNEQLRQLLSGRTPNFATLSQTGANIFFPDNTWNASLGDLFSWSCETTPGVSDPTNNPNGYSYGTGGISSGARATLSSDTLAAIGQSLCPPGQSFPLTIIQKNLPTHLLR